MCLVLVSVAGFLYRLRTVAFYLAPAQLLGQLCNRWERIGVVGASHLLLQAVWTASQRENFPSGVTWVNQELRQQGMIIPVSVWAVPEHLQRQTLLVDPDALLETGLAGSILKAPVFLQSFSFRRWIIPCHFFPAWWQSPLCWQPSIWG